MEQIDKFFMNEAVLVVDGKIIGKGHNKSIFRHFAWRNGLFGKCWEAKKMISTVKPLFIPL